MGAVFVVAMTIVTKVRQSREGTAIHLLKGAGAHKQGDICEGGSQEVVVMSFNATTVTLSQGLKLHHMLD